MSRRERRLQSTTLPRWRRTRGRVIAVTVVVIIAFAAIFVDVRLSAPASSAVVTSTLHGTFAAATPAVSLSWPAMGQAAIAVPSVGIAVTSGPERPVPVASLTKMMTAFIILRDHPLAQGQNGPNITISQADVADYDGDTTTDEANALVALGEVLTERQMMGGMLVHSADNLADALARWDAGTIPAFVEKMNRAAAQLGMDHTHYADPSGFNVASQSTAGDVLKVATPDMANPTFASFALMTSITLPVAGTVSTYTPLLGFDGVIGVKSGFTNAAGGCDVLAAVRSAHGLPVLILSAVTGQEGPNVLGLAGSAALTLANSVTRFIGASTVAHSGDVVAHVSAARHTVDATVNASATVLNWPGGQATRVLESTEAVVAGAKRGTRIGSLVVVLGTQHLVIPVVLHQDLPKETLAQRLF